MLGLRDRGSMCPNAYHRPRPEAPPFLSGSNGVATVSEEWRDQD